MSINNRKDVLLLLLYSPGLTDSVNEPIEGRTRLVKMLFLFRKELLSSFKKGTQLDLDTFYDFEVYRFGPFSADIYADLDFFIINGFIATEQIEASDPLPESTEYIRYEALRREGGFAGWIGLALKSNRPATPPGSMLGSPETIGREPGSQVVNQCVDLL